jgi:hypothetical protein
MIVLDKHIPPMGFSHIPGFDARQDMQVHVDWHILKKLEKQLKNNLSI